MIEVKRLENPTGMTSPRSEHHLSNDVVVVLDEQIEGITDLCVRAYAKGEFSYWRNMNLGQSTLFRWPGKRYSWRRIEPWIRILACTCPGDSSRGWAVCYNRWGRWQDCVGGFVVWTRGDCIWKVSLSRSFPIMLRGTSQRRAEETWVRSIFRKVVRGDPTLAQRNRSWFWHRGPLHTSTKTSISIQAS